MFSVCLPSHCLSPHAHSIPQESNSLMTCVVAVTLPPLHAYVPLILNNVHVAAAAGWKACSTHSQVTKLYSHAMPFICSYPSKYISHCQISTRILTPPTNILGCQATFACQTETALVQSHPTRTSHIAPSMSLYSS